jgi:hypothetical protein
VPDLGKPHFQPKTKLVQGFEGVASVMQHDVFISYTTQDKPTADAICHTLEAQGVRCWIAPRDIQLGDNYAETIIKAINAAKLMVLVFSSGTNSSRHVGNEVERAFNRGVPVIPFRIEDTQATGALEYFLSMPHWLDAFSPPLQQHLASLGESVRGLLAARVEQQAETTAAPTPRSIATAPVSPPPQSPKRSLRVPLALVGAAVVLAAVGFAAIQLSGPKSDNKIMSAPAPVAQQAMAEPPAQAVPVPQPAPAPAARPEPRPAAAEPAPAATSSPAPVEQSKPEEAATPPAPMKRLREAVEPEGKAFLKNPGQIGMVVRILPEEVAKNMPRKEVHGAVVEEVVPNSPAASVGIRPGDRVIGFAGQPVGTPTELRRIIMELKRPRFVFITFNRDGQNTRLVMKIPALRQTNGGNE